MRREERGGEEGEKRNPDVGRGSVPVVQNSRVGAGAGDGGVAGVAHPTVHVAVVAEDGLGLVLGHAGAHLLHDLNVGLAGDAVGEAQHVKLLLGLVHADFHVLHRQRTRSR